jgi:hypothetical protein
MTEFGYCPDSGAYVVCCHVVSRSPNRVLCACRIAIEQQAALVPVLALGEVLQLRNLYDMPALQQYTYKRVGFPGRC